MNSGLPEVLLRQADTLTQISYGSQVAASKSIWSLSSKAEDRCAGWDVGLSLRRENPTAALNRPSRKSTDTLST